jgi:hypothetical protein
VRAQAISHILAVDAAVHPGERIARLIERDGGMSAEAAFESRRLLALARVDYVVLMLAGARPPA